MVATYRVGAASASGGLAYGQYLISSALLHEKAAAAQYYAGGATPRDVPEPAIELRPDLSQEFARHLGIDTKRPLTLTEFAHLMNNRMATGAEIVGRKKHSAHQSVASVFGLPNDTMPTEEAIRNVLAGRRADGLEPRSDLGNQPPLAEERVVSALRKFRSAIGVPGDRDVTDEEVARLAAGKIDGIDYLRQINSTAPPVGFVDITFDTDKSLGISWGQEKDPFIRDLIMSDVHGATADAMAYAETVLGIARNGAGGSGETEPAELIWAGVQHYTARPATDVKRYDGLGREYTDTREIPTEAADVHIHQHRIIFSSMRTADGRIRAIDLDRLDGEIKIIGAVFHAALATRLRRHGAEVTLGPHGEARVANYAEWVRKFHSRRSTQGEETAREWAKTQGKDWDSLDGEDRIALLRAGVEKSREAKQKRRADEGLSDIETWQRDAERAGYKHTSAINLSRPAMLQTKEQRIEAARAASLPLISEAFKTRAVVSESEIKEFAARGLVAAGIGPDPGGDIDAVMQTYKDRGVRVGTTETRLVFGESYRDKRKTNVVTTAHSISEEQELFDRVQRLAADKTGGLTHAEIDAAAERFLARNPRIDPEGAQWKAQFKMAHDLGTAGRASLAVGVAGSGKTSTVVAVLVDAWHQRGLVVDGMTVPWKATAPLKAAGVDNAIAIEAYIRRVTSGKHPMDSNTILLADEVSMIPVRQQNELTRLVEERGARIVEIGDPRQCQSVETAAIDVISKALGDEEIPKLLTSIRQKTQRNRDIATMFRQGRAADGLAAMREDGNLHIVAGGPDETIKAMVAEWRRRTDQNAQDPDYSLIVVTDTNARALDVGLAVQADRRERGEVGKEQTTLKAYDPNSKASFDLSISVGDKVRTFTRTFDADSAAGDRKYLSSNGDVVEVLKILPDGLRVRNGDGDEGRVTWAQMKPWRAPKTDPVRLSLGYALTIDSSQSLTKSDVLWPVLDGSKKATGYKAHTALTRHEGSVQIFLSDAAERTDLLSKQMLGMKRTPSETEVVANMAANFSRFLPKALAMEMRGRENSEPSARRPGRGRTASQGRRPAGARAAPGQPPPQPAARPSQAAASPQQPKEQKRLVGPENRQRQRQASRPTAQPTPNTPKRTTKMSAVDAQAAFAAELERQGFRVSGAPRMDDRWHNAKYAEGGKLHAGGYKFSERGGVIHKFRGDEFIQWRPEAGSSDTLTAEQRAAQQVADQAARIAQRQENELRDNRIAGQAQATWSAARAPHPRHGYLEKKQINGAGLRMGSAGQTVTMKDGSELRVGGWLMFPLQNAEGEVRNIQFVSPDGSKKYFLPGSTKGLFFVDGDLNAPGPVIIGEGGATGKSLREMTRGVTTVSAMSADNLMLVAMMLRNRYPEKPIIFGADNDFHLPLGTPPLDNIGVVKSQAAAERVGGVVLIPQLPTMDRSLDFNDLRTTLGASASKIAIEVAFRQKGIEELLPAARAEVSAKISVTPEERAAMRESVNPKTQRASTAAAARAMQERQQRLNHNRGPR